MMLVDTKTGACRFRVLPVVLTMVATAVVMLAAAVVAEAHPLSPSLLEIKESGGGRAEVVWTTPSMRVRGADFWPVLPDQCRRLSESLPVIQGARSIERWTVYCEGGSLVGREIGVAGLSSSYTDVLVRLSLSDGRVISKVLRASAPFMTVPAGVTRGVVFRDYSVMGGEHILGGWDHLLFVFGLLLLVGGGRSLVKTITAFTLGHSLTLALAVLGYLPVSSAPVEAAIALTILLLAVELSRVRQGRRAWTGRRPWAMAAGFGLLHGMGFAGALAEVGLPGNEIPLALFSFNLGIEAGQLLFVSAAGLAWWVLRVPLQRRPPWFDWVPIYTIGALAAYLCIKRSVAVAAIVSIG